MEILPELFQDLFQELFPSLPAAETNTIPFEAAIVLAILITAAEPQRCGSAGFGEPATVQS